MVAFARKPNVPAPVRGGNRVAARTRNGVFRDGKYEGRLVRTESLPSVPAVAKVRVENVCDYMGRRVAKTVSSDYSGGAYSTTNVTTFVYDGWLPVAEIIDDGSSVSTNRNVWGLDLSGSTQGAGGVGGLLATIQDGEGYFACLDGNGNVCQYVDADGAVVAHREYDPFGGTVALTGVKKDDFSAWFSTKPLDRETGLYAYTFRLYDPELGRWLSKDPIEESGGANLYGFVDNTGVNGIDFLGLLGIVIGYDERGNVVRAGSGKKPVFPKEGKLSGPFVFDVRDLSDNASVGLIVVGVEMSRTGQFRLDYAKLASQLKSKGLSDAAAIAIRDRLKIEFRDKGPALFKAWTQQVLRERAARGHITGKSNPAKTNVKLNATARVLRNAGRATAAIGIAFEVVNLATTPDEELGEEVLKTGGRLAGGFAGGAAVGAGLGAAGLNPLTVGVGALAGGVVGSLIGEGVVEACIGDE